MTYVKQNFVSGQVLESNQLNHIEEGLAEIYDSKETIIDATLTQAGQAADAAAVGNELAYIKSLLTDKNIDTLINTTFKLPRTGKVYSVKIPKFASNQTTTCVKTDDNENLICKPSTDSVEGKDDYTDIPLFRWYNCNYERDEFGHAYPTEIEGLTDGYVSYGNVDVGVIQMTPYIKWDETPSDHILLSITDTPREGYSIWCEGKSNGQEYPYVIHSKYFSGIGVDGYLRSLPNLAPERLQSYVNMIASYSKKGAGYHGAAETRNTWQVIFILIKYATKSSQSVFTGCTNYNFQYEASIKRSTKETYFPVTKAQVNNIVVGSYVTVGYGSGTSTTPDREIKTTYSYADNARVTSIEAIDDNNYAIYLDIDEGFTTNPVSNAPIVMSSIFWKSGTTDSVIGKHDGSMRSNTNGIYPYRVQGVEYAVGAYSVASDIVLDIQSNCDKTIYACRPENARIREIEDIRTSYINVGTIACNKGTADYWVGDIHLDIATGITYPSSIGSGDKTGIGDKFSVGGTATSGQREFLRGGNIGLGSDAGFSCILTWASMDRANWHFISAD